MERKITAKKLWWILPTVVLIAVIICCVKAFSKKDETDDNVFYDSNIDKEIAYLVEASSDPVEAAINTFENEVDKDFTLSFELYGAIIDEEETEYRRELLKGSDYAMSNGWSDEFLDEHFVIVYVEYYVEYDHDKTYLDDGYTGLHVYMIEYDDLWYPYDTSNQCGFIGIFEEDAAGHTHWTKDDVAAYNAATAYLEKNFSDVEICGYKLDYTKALSVIREYPDLAEERGWRWSQIPTYDYTFYVVYAEYCDGDDYAAVWLWMEKDLDTGEWSCYKADTDVELEGKFID